MSRSPEPYPGRQNSSGALLEWFPLLTAPVLLIAVGRSWPPWVLMWALAGVIFAGFKLLTWREALRQGVEVSWKRSLAYLLLWPGMEARRFLAGRRPSRPTARAWGTAAVQMLLGGLLLWVAARRVSPQSALLAGWIGMLGLILTLHFGSFRLLALAWQSVGVDAMPIMQRPLAARSLAQFWGERWNVAFHELARNLLFERIRVRIGAAAAILTTFLASGLIHDLVISVPAKGGYGLPTAYFALQGGAILAERAFFHSARRDRSFWEKALQRVWTLTVAAGPAFWLFHPPFVRRVFLPFMRAVGAL